MTLPSPTTFGAAIDRFLRTQEGRNRSSQTIRAYRSDLTQLATCLHMDNPLLTDPTDVATGDLHEFLAHLAREGRSGVSRARKLAPSARLLYSDTLPADRRLHLSVLCPAPQ